MVGNVDSGKSTLVGVLSKGEKDDGRGAARQRVFNYIHEQKSGRTTSVTQVCLLFRKSWVSIRTIYPFTQRVSITKRTYIGQK